MVAVWLGPFQKLKSSVLIPNQNSSNIFYESLVAQIVFKSKQFSTVQSKIKLIWYMLGDDKKSKDFILIMK